MLIKQKHTNIYEGFDVFLLRSNYTNHVQGYIIDSLHYIYFRKA